VRAYAAPEGSLISNRRFRRLVGYSLAWHAALFSLSLIGSCGRSMPIDTPAPVFVDLVAMPAPPAPKVAKAAAPARPKEKAVVIPKAEPKPKPKPAPKPEAKPEPKPEPEPKEKKPEPKPKAEAPPEPQPKKPDLSQLLSQIQQKVDARAPAAAAVTAKTGTGGGRGRLDPELAAYRKQLIMLLHSNWVGAGAFRTQPDLIVRYEVEIDRGGHVRSVSTLSPSGNRHYDESAERAIRKTAPFPRPPRGAVTLDVSFRPTSVL
jgi:colicin import membrane protein